MTAARCAGTGLTGLVGSRVAELTPQHRWHNLNCDITDAQAVDRSIGDSDADTVVHFAAFTATNEAWNQRGDRGGACYRVNVTGTRNVAAACQRHDRYLVHISTDYVFDGTQRDVYTELDETAGQDWYSQTKCWAEQEVRAAGCRYAILRPSFPFRARFARKEDLVRRMIRQLSSGLVPPLFTDTLVTPTFIDEFAVAVSKISEHKPSGVFHTVGSTHISPYELAVLLARKLGLAESLVPRGRLSDYLATSARPYPRYLNLSNSLAMATLGIRFSTLDTAVAELFRQLSAGAGALSRNRPSPVAER